MIFGSFASASENHVFRENYFNFTSIVLYCPLFDNRHFSYFQMLRTFTELWVSEYHHH